MQKSKALIIDIDGTLANVEHRVRHLHCDPKDWKSFHGSLMKDTPHDWCVEIINAFKSRGHSIILLTGRDADYRDLSVQWLEEHGIDYDHLHMRPEGDRRPDDIVKREFFETLISPIYEVSFVVEDRKSVVDMWRELGVVCLQCAPGNF